LLAVQLFEYCDANHFVTLVHYPVVR
jgi:hypothetical protein